MNPISSSTVPQSAPAVHRHHHGGHGKKGGASPLGGPTPPPSDGDADTVKGTVSTLPVNAPITGGIQGVNTLPFDAVFAGLKPGAQRLGAPAPVGGDLSTSAIPGAASGGSIDISA